jgi:GNAT superfamily N-acetyltransferase
LDDDNQSALAEAYAVECEATAQVRPGWVPLGAPARIAAWRAEDGWVRRLVGAFEGGSLIGFASVSTAHDTPDTSWVNVSVRPRHQRRGFGTSLAKAAEDASPVGTRRFVASAYRATAAGTDDLAQKFAHPLGYRVASTETVVELDLAGADLPAAPPANGYTVSTYLNGVPDHLRGQVGVLKGLVDAEAPNGDLAWEPAPVTVQDYEDEISLWQEQGRTAVESIALDPEGAVVAWTCLVAAADPARPAQIEGTMVLAAHRGVRLGRAVKVASLLVARDHTTSRQVRTSSDDKNVWMRAINHDLGFVPVESEIILQKQRFRSRGAGIRST